MGAEGLSRSHFGLLHLTRGTTKKFKTVRCASPIFKPIAYKLSCTNRKRKYFEEKTTATLKIKQTSIATVRKHFRTLASFPTPLIFHWSLPLIYTFTKRSFGDVSWEPTQPINMFLPTDSNLLYSRSNKKHYLPHLLF